MAMQLPEIAPILSVAALEHAAEPVLRAPSVVAATTLAGKLAACLDHYAADFPEARRASLFERLASIEAALDKKGQGYSGEARGGAMRVRRLRVGGVPAFGAPLVLDVDKLHGRVIAIVGPAGAGKSTLVESLLLGAYRKSATRGTFEELCGAADDALLALELDTAAGSWRATQRLDGPFVRTLPDDGHVFRGGSKKPGTSTELAAWVRRALPPLKLMLATQFAAQGDAGLLLMDPAPAKDLLLGLTGGEVYQRIAAEAGRRARELGRQIATLDGAIREAQRIADTEKDERDLLARMSAVEPEETAIAELRRRRDAMVAEAPADPGFELTRQALDARDRGASARRRRDAARARLRPIEAELRARVRASVEELPDARERMEALGAAVDEKGAEVLAARQALATATERRIEALRGAVSTLASRPKGSAALAKEVLGADDELAVLQLQGPERLRALEAELVERTRAATQQTIALADIERLAAMLDSVVQREAEEVEARAQADAAQAELDELEATARDLLAQAEEARAGYQALDLAPIDAEIASRSRALAEQRARAAAVAARVEAAQRAAVRVRSLSDDRARLEGEQEEWSVLDRAFGRAGIQALEVEALGPGLQQHANALLEEHTAGRWATAVHLTRESADGDDVETFAIRVHDRARDLWRSARSLSPGERVLVGEAVRAAISKLSCERSPDVEPTIVRDETAASADKIDGETWVRMVRAGADLVGASKVFVVTHDARVMRACDTTFVVKDGTWSEVAR